MVAVERVSEYANLPPEAALETKVDVETWPNSGSIKVEALNVRYRSDLPLSLKNISFEIESGKHIGIVGRTGSGKFLDAPALFQINKYCANIEYLL